MTGANIAAWLFRLAGLLFVVAALVPVLGGQPIKTSLLTFAVVFFLLSLGVRARRPPPSPPGPGA